MIKHRALTVDDVPQLCILIDGMLAEGGLAPTTSAKITALVASDRTISNCVTDGDQMVGFSCAIVHENLFNDVRRVTDVGIYLLPEYRSMHLFRQQLKDIEQWAKDRGATEVWLGQTTGYQPDRMAKLYQIFGYKLCGYNSKKDI